MYYLSYFLRYVRRLLSFYKKYIVNNLKLMSEPELGDGLYDESTDSHKDLKEAYNYKQDRVDEFWILYYEIGSYLQKWEKKDFSASKKQMINHKFIRGLELSKHSYEIGKLKTLKGIYCDIFLEDSGKAQQYYEEAEKEYLKIEYYYAQSLVAGLKLNKSIAKDFKKGNYQDVIDIVSLLNKTLFTIEYINVLC